MLATSTHSRVITTTLSHMHAQCWLQAHTAEESHTCMLSAGYRHTQQRNHNHTVTHALLSAGYRHTQQRNHTHACSVLATGTHSRGITTGHTHACSVLAAQVEFQVVYATINISSAITL